VAFRDQIDCLLGDLDSSVEVGLITCESIPRRETVAKVVQHFISNAMAFRGQIDRILRDLDSSVEVGLVTRESISRRETVTEVV
jgi:hypothetical protein